jgi:hypothetical protein
MDNKADTCPRCGRSQSPGVSLQAPESPPAGEEESTPDTHPAEEGRARWLRRELWSAVRVVAKSVAISLVFASIGGFLGFLLFGIRGLPWGAAAGWVLKILLRGL